MTANILISTPAKRYARALLEVAIKNRNFTKVLEDLESFSKQLAETGILRSLFLSPAVPASKKEKILDEIGSRAKYEKVSSNFLKTLVRHERLNILDQINASIEQQFLERQGIIVVEVTSARKLDPDEQKGLVDKLEQFTGKKVQIENNVDRSLIGGAITRIGTTVYDGSVLAQLEQLKSKIVAS